MAFYHLRISLYLNLKAAHLLRSRCADPAIGGNPELFILLWNRRYNPNLFHGSSSLYKMNIHENYMRKRKDAKVILSRRNYTHYRNVPNPCYFSVQSFCNRHTTSQCLVAVIPMTVESGTPLVSGYIFETITCCRLFSQVSRL